MDKLAHSKIEALEHFMGYITDHSPGAVEKYVDHLNEEISWYKFGNEDLEDYKEAVIDVWEKQQGTKWQH